MKILYVGCKVRIVDELSPFQMFFFGPVRGSEGVIVDKNTLSECPWVVEATGRPGTLLAHEDALEPILPEGLLEQIREEALDLEPELAT